MIGLVVPTPTFPDPSTISRVAVDEPTTNSGMPEPNAFGFTDSKPQGEDEATDAVVANVEEAIKENGEVAVSQRAVEVD